MFWLFKVDALGQLNSFRVPQSKELGSDMGLLGKSDVTIIQTDIRRSPYPNSSRSCQANVNRISRTVKVC